MIGCSLPTLRKALRLLRQFRLIEEERQGLGRPNRIYLTRYEDPGAGETPLPIQKERIFPSGQKKPFPQIKKKRNKKIQRSFLLLTGDDTQTPLSKDCHGTLSSRPTAQPRSCQPC